MLRKSFNPKYSLAKVLEPIVLKVYCKIKFFAEKKPRLSLCLMLVITFTNAAIVFEYIRKERRKKGPIVANTSYNIKRDSLPIVGNERPRSTGVFSLEKYFAIMRFRDSLQYFRDKKPLTHEDSLRLIQLLKSYEAIDPDFIAQLKSFRTPKK